MSKKASKRGWNDDYIQYGFAHFSDKAAQKGQCVICYKVLGNDLLRPNKLSNHLLKIHPEHKDKGIAFFERKRDALKRAKLDSIRTRKIFHLLKLLMKLHLRSQNKISPTQQLKLL